jgi:hypothetical protein
LTGFESNQIGHCSPGPAYQHPIPPLSQPLPASIAGAPLPATQTLPLLRVALRRARPLLPSAAWLTPSPCGPPSSYSTVPPLKGLATAAAPTTYSPFRTPSPLARPRETLPDPTPPPHRPTSHPPPSAREPSTPARIVRKCHRRPLPW